MANITPAVTRVLGMGSLDGYQVVWGPMANGDVGIGVGSAIGDGAGATTVPGSGFFSGFADKSVQVEGTFGAGGSIAVEGTNDGNVLHYRQLTDPQGTTIAIASAGIKAITEAVIWVRPHVTAGDGTTAVTVSMFFRKTQAP